MNCNNCGKSISDDSTFCIYCGANINKLNSENYNNPFVSNFPLQYNNVKPPKNKKNIFLIASSIVIISFLVFFIWGLYQSSVSTDFNKEVLEQLIVTTYQIENDNRTVIVKVENTSEYNLDIDLKLRVYAQSDGSTFTMHQTEPAIENGEAIIFGFYINPEYHPDGPYDTDYELSVEETLFDCVVSDLSYESVSAADKEIISVTNNGVYDAEGVFGTVLFFNGDILVGIDYPFFSDSDSGFKPGETITEEVSCNSSYDSFEVYFTGRR